MRLPGKWGKISLYKEFTFKKAGAPAWPSAGGKDADPMFSAKDLRRLILPLVVEQLLLVTVGMADTVMVSSVGQEAVSSISLVDAINLLLINVFSALGTGGAILVGVVVYLVLVLALRILSKEDLEMMPKGDKIAKILHIR